MSPLELSPDKMRENAGEIERALFRHGRWTDELNRTLICAMRPDERDMAPDAHLHCPFGQWLYGGGETLFSNRAAVEELKETHENVHVLAREMLGVMAAGGKVPLALYERFAGANHYLRMEILAAKWELDDAVYGLDPLSGAANRIGMMARLREQKSLVERGRHSCTIAMLDLDHFKRINDVCGHAVGDQVISVVAKLIMGNMRPYDMLFRYGGEEFLICEPDTDLETGYDMMERLRDDIAALRFDDGNGQSFQATASFGVTLLDPVIPVEESIHRADSAMYAAKRAGRNCVRAWSPAMALSAA